MLALPPSDPALYEESKRGVVFVAPFHIPHAKPEKKKKKKTGEESKSKKNKNKKKRGYVSSSDESDSDEVEEEKEMKDKFHEEWEKKRKTKTTKEHDTNALLVEDHYQILGLEDLGIAATEQHIKTAYRKLALEYHPDKGRKAQEGEDDNESQLNPEQKVKKEIWLKIQKAYETLMDPEKRRKFDSSLPFDESIPDDEDITDENFYELFTEVFNRNAMWAKNKPAPQLGGPKTPIKKVFKFYKYWDSFETTRDFSNYDEYDLEEAADKYEKRYMQKENMKCREKYVKAERVRLNELHRIAYRNDPRVRAENERIEKEKADKRREKFEKKQKAKEERQRKEDEIKRKEEDAIRKIEEEKERGRKKIHEQKKIRESMIENLMELADQKLKQFHYEYDRFFIDDYVKKLKDEDIKTLVDQVTNMKETQEDFEKIKKLIDKKEDENQQRIKERQAKEKAKQEEKKVKQKEWSKEDFAHLAKALNKFPGGTPDRWKTIANFMGTEYTSKDVIDMAKQLTQKKTLAKAGKGAFKNEPEKIIRSKGASDETVDTNGTTDDGWSDEEQKLLEEALKKYPKTLPPKERWGSIAKEIPGKTPKECLARFKHICALIKNKSK